MPDKLILVARIAGAFGVKGEVRISTYTENPLAVLNYRSLIREDGQPALTLVSGRSFNGGIVARAKEIETKEQADKLRGLKLFVDRDTLPPPEEDEFYQADLIGLEVVSPDGTVLGKVKSLQDFGAGELLEIEAGKGRAGWYLPFTLECVPQIDLAAGRLTVVRPPETADRDHKSAKS
jgi:16S rRNA processing protein RimM